MPIELNIMMRTLLSERVKVLAYIRSIVRQRDLAEDIFQEVCVLALEKREEIENEGHLLGWLRHASRLRTMNVVRREQGGPGVRMPLNDAVLDLLEITWRKHDAIGGGELSEALRTCLETLPERSRQLLRERYTEGRAVKEMAERQNRPVGSLRVTLSRIHRALSDCVYRRVVLEGRHGL